MSLQKGSKTYLFIPASDWTGLVPHFISKEAHPTQSLGWYNEEEPPVWVRPTWQQAYQRGQLGPIVELTDSTQSRNWFLTSFVRGFHPPMLNYSSSAKGILQTVGNQGGTVYDFTLEDWLDETTPKVVYLSWEEVQELLYNLPRLSLAAV